MLVCWSLKGGSGTSVVTAGLAVLSARTQPTLLVDLAGDLPAVLGVPEPNGPGVQQWLASPVADAVALHRLATVVAADLDLVAAGGGMREPVETSRWQALAAALHAADAQVVVDAGHGVPPAPLLAGSTNLLVTRACFLSLRRASASPVVPDGVVLIREPGRVLGRRDIEHATRAPVVAEVEWDPAIARAVDSGLLAGRLPSSLGHGLRRAA